MSSIARRILLPLGVALTVATPFAIADALGPGSSEPIIAAAVAGTMQAGHYAAISPTKHDGIALDDALSREWLDTYLDRLDWERIYFTAEDIASFKAKYADTLDDDILRGNPSLAAAFEIHDRLLQHMRERTEFVRQQLEANAFDFSDPERTVDLERHEGSWPATKAESDAIWRDRIAEQVLRMELAGEERATILERLSKRYHRILVDRESLEPSDVLEIYLGALTNLYDPHSTWFQPISKENFDIDMRDSLTGIGAVLRMEEGYTTIEELVAGGPAAESGQLATKDRILAVTQADGETVDIVEMRLDKVVQLIRGPIDTRVVLTVHPADAPNTSTTKDVVLVRDKVKLDRAAASATLEDVGGLKVGVIDVPSFYVDNVARQARVPDYGSTANDMKRLLGEMQDQGADAILVDLRGNGGGALDQSIEATGLFLDTGPVVQIRDRDGRVEVLNDDDAGVAWAGPLVVLVDEASASASEIFAGAIKDHGRGLVIGSPTTHGKGTVQNLLSLDRALRRMGHREAAEAGGAVKYTTHMFFRPAGESTQVRGVPTDVVLPSPYEGLEIRESDLDHALPFDQVPPATFVKRKLGVDPATLQAASDARVKASMEFAFLREDLDERARNRAKTTLSLNRATRQAEIDLREQVMEARKAAREAQAELEAERAGTERAAPADASDEAEEDPAPDAIRTEALQIVVDFVTRLRA